MDNKWVVRAEIDEGVVIYGNLIKEMIIVIWRQG